MADADTRPTEFNILHYGGDTLGIHITAPTEVTTGREWAGHVRRARNSAKVDAELYFLPDGDGLGWTAVLAEEDAERLAQRGDFEGFYDIQLANIGGGDPVTTIVHGTLTITTDVTRVTA